MAFGKKYLLYFMDDWINLKKVNFDHIYNLLDVEKNKNIKYNIMYRTSYRFSTLKWIKRKIIIIHVIYITRINNY